MEVKKATISPSTMAYDNVSPSLAPVPTNDGTKIDQGVAYGLMLVALVLTYFIH
uniref:Arabinogalactan peptide 22 n=1 Tax=Solanum tuberosum TaxID=4113 RepID=M1AIG7_SOLTU